LRIRISNRSDVDSLLAFLARAGVSACRVAESIVEIDATKQELALLLGVWQTMHPGAGFAWA
jgi:hypothetical protein